MSYSEKAIKILGDSLAQHKKAIKDIQETISKDKNLHSQEAVQLKSQIQKQLTEVDKSMRSYIEAIPIPKNGKDAVVDYENIFEFIAKEVLKIEPEKVNYDAINSTIEEKVSKIPTPENGKPGKDAIDGKDGISPTIDYAKVNKGVMSQFPKKEIIADVKKSIPESEAVVGIKDIKYKNGKLIVETTDGKKISFDVSPKQYNIFGDGGGAKPDLLAERIVKVAENTSLNNVSQTVLVDASVDDVEILLPDPAESFSQGHSIRIAITKIDLEANIVTIVPFGSELILNEASQTVEIREVINLITDGLNWYYGS